VVKESLNLTNAKMIMKKTILHLTILLLLEGFFPLALKAEKIMVVTTIFPLKEFAQAVGADRIKVEQLLPPGAEAHSWEPKPSDIMKLSQAALFIYISSEMEVWVPEILKTRENPRLIVIEASQGLTLLKTGERKAEDEKNHHSHSPNPNRVDPHLWLNFSYDQKVIDKIVGALIQIDPQNSQYYQRNGEAYKAKLKDLDLRYRNELSQCESRTIILGGHSAFGYLAERYGLEQISLYGISPNAEPTPKKMAELITIIKKYRARAIYCEELVSDKLAKAIAQETGAKLLVLNPGVNLTRKQIKSQVTFLSLMESNLRNLKYGLNCRP